MKINSASIDRCLRPVRCKSPRGLGTTKPGSLLKSLIPVQTFTTWDEEQLGIMEIDLVAHCGNTTEGQYLNTLTCTDLSTGWTDVTALAHRSQQAVSIAIHHMRSPLQENDQAHVEQKNWSVVRHTLGYDRWENGSRVRHSGKHPC